MLSVPLFSGSEGVAAPTGQRAMIGGGESARDAMLKSIKGGGVLFPPLFFFRDSTHRTGYKSLHFVKRKLPHKLMCPSKALRRQPLAVTMQTSLPF